MKNIVYTIRIIWKVDKISLFYQLFLALWNGVVVVSTTLSLKFLIQGAIDSSSMITMLTIAVAYVSVTWISMFSRSGIYGRIQTRLYIRLEKYLTSMFVDKLIAIDAKQFDDPEFYDDLVKGSAAVTVRVNSTFLQFGSLLSSLFGAISSISMMAMLSPVFIVVCIIAVATSYFANIIFAKKRFKYNEKVVPLERRENYYKGLLFQRTTINDVKQYPTFGKVIYNKFINSMNLKHSLQIDLANKQMLHSFKIDSISAIATNLVPYIYIAYGAVVKIVAPADMASLISAFSFLFNSFNGVSNLLAGLKEHSMYIEHFKKFLKYSPIIETTDGIELTYVKTIEFNNIKFKYPNTEHFVLDNVNFTITKGQKTALVGINGAGKTTIVKLMMRFYDPDSGAILINGRDIREYDVQSLRRVITSVFQEFQAYSLPIDELVSCAEGDTIDATKVREALRRVGLLDKVEAGANGIHTEYSKYFDENGLVFSGGQLQKLIIARMLYKGSDVLIMDEPSSALDPESEYEINRDIMDAAKGKTVILISHRLSTTRDADNIILIEDGEVKEQGTHNELLTQNGRYAHLFNIQASGYVENATDPETAVG